jgi:RimJ/RimL family protein N-acetyltransferase
VDREQPLVSLRPLADGDVDVMAGWAADAGFCRAAEWSVDLPHLEYVAFFRALVEAPPPELLRLAVVRDGRLVGYVDLHGSAPETRELGFVIGERATWGLGLGYAAAVAAVDHGFEALGLGSIWAEAREDNERSLRILRRLGMTDRGHGATGSDDAGGGFRRFDLAQTDWRARAAR